MAAEAQKKKTTTFFHPFSPQHLFFITTIILAITEAMSVTLRIRKPKSNAPESIQLDLQSSWADALSIFSSMTDIPKDRVRVLTGFPPKPLEADLGATVADLKLRPNDLFILQEGESQVQIGTTGGKYVPPASEKAHFTRRQCPADNSCLFHAAAYVLRNKSRTDGPVIRRECVEAVLSHPEMFNESTMGMNPHEYAVWLSQKDTWGGAIELEVLSFLYQTELIALDLESSSVQRFGSDKGYSVRSFLVFTGNHYDCIAMNPMYNSSSEKDDQVVFNSRDENVLARAKRFVAEEGQKMKKG